MSERPGYAKCADGCIASRSWRWSIGSGNTRNSDSAQTCKGTFAICLNNIGIQVSETVVPGGVGAGGAIGIGKTVAEATTAKAEAVAANVAKVNQLQTNTVFDAIKGTQPVYPGSVIPKSFEMTLPNGHKVWVHGNATEHMAEYAASRPLTILLKQ